MKKVFYLCCLMFLSIKGIAQYTEDPNFDAVINDNFDVSPRYWDNSYSDSEYIWKAYFAATGITHGNSEHQVYQRSHAVFDTINDMMILVADYVSDTDLGCDDVEVPTGIYCNISNNYSIRYFSGAIESIQKSFLYGYFEIRCKLPVHRGAFPAFWLWGGNNTTDPHYEEIDIFEYSWNITKPGYNHYSHGLGDTRCITAGMYYNTNGSYNNNSSIARILTRVSNNKPSMNQWNTFGCLWMPDKVIWYLNGEEFNSYYVRDSIPHHPLYLMANYAIDNFIMTIDENHDTTFYIYNDIMYIDYIKAYEPIWDCDNCVFIENQYQLDNYEHGIKRSVTISNNDSIPLLIDASDKKSIMASEYVLIEGPFHVNSRANFSIMIHNCSENNIQSSTN